MKRRVAAGVLALLVIASVGAVAMSATTATGMPRYILTVYATNRNVVTCKADPPYTSCPLESTSVVYLYVTNLNAPDRPPAKQIPGRAGIKNAFVVTSIDYVYEHDGAVLNGATFYPPGSPNYEPIDPAIVTFDLRWPVSVACTTPTDCTPYLPTVLPGENTVVFYPGFLFRYGIELPGTDVFRFTVHGLANGSPLDLHGNTGRITVTD